MRRLVIGFELMLFTLGTTVMSAQAQVFIAAKSRPEFSIAPLFLSVSVKSEESGRGSAR